MNIIIKKVFKSNKFTFSLYKKFKSVRKFFEGTRIVDFLNFKKIVLIIKVKPYTLLSYRRLSNLYERGGGLKIAYDSLVECGSWNGGSGGILAKVAGNKKVWLLDSWEGMPEPTKEDIKFGKVKKYVAKKGLQNSSYNRAEELIFDKLGMSNKNIHLVKGWFEKTISTIKEDIGKIGLLHLDCDWYESVKFCLDELYDNVCIGGVIVIDDYGDWGGCKKAVDEYILRKKLTVDLIKIDQKGVYFIKK